MDHDLREAERQCKDDPTPETRLRAVSAFFRAGRQAPVACFRVGDVVLQHSCSEGYGPWRCRVEGFRHGRPVSIGVDGGDYSGCHIDLIELLVPVEHVAP